MNLDNNKLNQDNAYQAANTELIWEKPVLYKEEWLNTLSGADPSFESSSFFTS
jgi:hypothetical protein